MGYYFLFSLQINFAAQSYYFFLTYTNKFAKFRKNTAKNFRRETTLYEGPTYNAGEIEPNNEPRLRAAELRHKKSTAGTNDKFSGPKVLRSASRAR